MKPVIVFVHGGWHSPDCFDKVIAVLSSKDYYTRKVYLPSVHRSPPVTSMEPDVEAIRAVALTELQQGRDVAVVCHSYGGIPTSQALEGLHEPQGPDGQGRVKAIIYLTAMIFLEGDSAGTMKEKVGHDGVDFPLDLTADGSFIFQKDSDPASFFYNDIPREEADYWVSRLKGHAAGSFATPLQYAAWKDIPTWYLYALQDNAILIKVQRRFVQEARDYLDRTKGAGTGDRWITTAELDTSHSPFLSQPVETALFIERAATSVPS